MRGNKKKKITVKEEYSDLTCQYRMEQNTLIMYIFKEICELWTQKLILTMFNNINGWCANITEEEQIILDKTKIDLNVDFVTYCRTE